MSYRDYLARQSELTVRTSDVESRASGLAIGRLEVWPPRSARGQDVVRLIQDSGLDVVIVRVGAEDVELAAALNTETLISWQADTLLYFKVASKPLAAGSPPDGLVQLSLADGPDADVLVERIFADYSNHYSANPALRKINVVTAYQDWTRTALGSTRNAVFKTLSDKGAPAGLCVTDVEDESCDEVLLAGIVPEERGRGAYQDMIRMIGVRAQAASKESVVISTQAANIGVMRAWCRLGFLPTIALNTIHVVRREIYRAALGD